MLKKLGQLILSFWSSLISTIKISRALKPGLIRFFFHPKQCFSLTDSSRIPPNHPNSSRTIPSKRGHIENKGNQVTSLIQIHHYVKMEGDHSRTANDKEPFENNKGQRTDTLYWTRSHQHLGSANLKFQFSNGSNSKQHVEVYHNSCCISPWCRDILSSNFTCSN